MLSEEPSCPRSCYYSLHYRDLALGRSPRCPHTVMSSLWIRGHHCDFPFSWMFSAGQDFCSEHTGQEQRPREAGTQALVVTNSRCQGEKTYGEGQTAPIFLLMYSEHLWPRGCMFQSFLSTALFWWLFISGLCPIAFWAPFFFVYFFAHKEESQSV